MKDKSFEEKVGEILDVLKYEVNRDDISFAWDYFFDAKTALLALVREEVGSKYEELIMAVGKKFEGETRHETALRYIRQAEESKDTGAQSIAKRLGEK